MNSYVTFRAAGGRQDAVYDQCAQPLVDSLFRGINATVLAYGQTGPAPAPIPPPPLCQPPPRPPARAGLAGSLGATASRRATLCGGQCIAARKNGEIPLRRTSRKKKSRAHARPARTWNGPGGKRRTRTRNWGG